MFLDVLIHSEPEEVISSLSPFIVKKTIMGMAEDPKSIKNPRSDGILVLCSKTLLTRQTSFK